MGVATKQLRAKIRGAIEASRKAKTNVQCPYGGEEEFWVIVERVGVETQRSSERCESNVDVEGDVANLTMFQTNANMWAMGEQKGSDSTAQKGGKGAES